MNYDDDLFHRARPQTVDILNPEWRSFLAKVQECNPSNTRSASHPSHPPISLSSTEDVSPYLCHDDDSKFLRAFRQENDDYRCRLKWLWFCVTVAAPDVNSDERRMLWRSLVDCNDVWLLWKDGDEAMLPCPIDPHDTLSSADWKGVADLIEIRGPGTQSSHTKLPPDAYGVYRLPMVLWVALLICNRSKQFTRPSLNEYQMPHLVSKWWSMIPPSIVNHCTTFFKPNHHSDDDDDSIKWTTWIFVQHFIQGTTPPSSDFRSRGPGSATSLDDGRDRIPQTLYCKPSHGTQNALLGSTYKPVKPHVVALWCIQKVVQRCGYPDYGASFSPHDHWRTSMVNNGLKADTVDLGDNLSYSVLARMDEWLKKMPGKDFPSDLPSPLSREMRRSIPDSDWIPNAWLPFLLEPRWKETEDAINSISPETSVSKKGLHVLPDSVDGVSWLCMLILFSIARYTGFGPATARTFARIIEYDFASIFENLPAPPMTESRGFREALYNSRHTCFKPATAHYYTCAYSLLCGVPQIVGCNQGVGYLGLSWIGETYRRCSVCANTDAFHTLGRFIDKNMDILGIDPDQDSITYPISLARKLVDGMNYPTRKELKILNGTLKTISDAFSKALDDSDGDDDDPIEFDDPDLDSGWVTETEKGDIGNHGTIERKAELENSIQIRNSPAVSLNPSTAMNVGSAANSTQLTELLAANMPRDLPMEGSIALDSDGIEDLIVLPDSPRAESSDLSIPSTSLSPHDCSVDDNNSNSFSFVHHSYNQKSKSKSKPDRPRKTEMVDEIKQRLKSLLESRGVVVEYINGEPKLPWKSLPRVLRNHNLKFVNWPPGVAEPHTRNGIEKVPLEDIVKLYDAINRKDRALDICLITDDLGQPEMSVVMESPSCSRSSRKRALCQIEDNEDSSHDKRNRQRVTR